MNNIPRSRKNGNIVTMETVTVSIRSSEKTCFLYHSNYVVKTVFFQKKSSRTLILANCYSKIQSHSKIYHDLTLLFNVYFLFESHEHSGSLTKSCLKLDKNKSIPSTFSLFVVCKSAVSTIQKSNYVGCFNFRQ